MALVVAAAGSAPALLAGVGAGLTGTAAQAAAVADGWCVASGLSTTCTFDFTGASQSWVVPAGVQSATFEVVGAAGGGYRACCGGSGGGVKALTKVVPGTTMQINVGGKGGTYTGLGGWNGGGNGGSAALAHGGGGGGASDVRIAPFTLDMRTIVGGGGGGVGSPSLVYGAPKTALGGAGGGSVGGGFQAGQRGADSATSPAGGGGGGTNLPGGGGAGGPGLRTDSCGGVSAFTVSGNGGSSAVGGAGGYMRKGGTDQPCYGLGGWGGGGGGGHAGGGGGGGGSEGGAGGGGGSGFGPGTSTSFLGAPGADGQVKVTYLSPSTSAWVSLGGQVGAAPTISERPASGLVDAVQDLFYLNAADHIIHRTLTTGVLGPEEDLGGPFYPGSTIAAVSYTFDRIDIFARATNNLIFHSYHIGGPNWSAWVAVGYPTTVTSSPTVSSWGPGRLDVFARGTNNQMLHSWSNDGSSFAAFENLAGNLDTAPAAVSWGNNRIDISASNVTTNPLGTSLQQKRWDGTWSHWFDIFTTDRGLTSAPTISSADIGKLDIYYRNSTNGLSRRSYDVSNGGWAATYNAGPVASPPGSAPAVASLTNGQQIVLLRSYDNTLIARTYP